MIVFPISVVILLISCQHTANHSRICSFLNQDLSDECLLTAYAMPENHLLINYLEFNWFIRFLTYFLLPL